MGETPPRYAALLRITPGLVRGKPYRASLFTAGNGNDSLLAVFDLGSLSSERLETRAKAFWAGDRTAAADMGDILAHWLFGLDEEEDLNRLNTLGEALRTWAAARTPARPIRLEIALHSRLATSPEF